MSSAQAPASRPSLRERRRSAAVQEIVGAAESHLTELGPHGLSLRAIARSLGMTVQALYHYFPSRDDLVTALITKAYDDLATAVQTASDAPPDDPDLPRMVVAAEGYRQWAIDHPERFQLLYGTPLRHYRAPVDGPTTEANRKMSGTFQRALFGGFTPAQLAAADVRSLSPDFLKDLEHVALDDLDHVPPPATALMLSVWGYLHGMVALEVFGHTAFLGAHQAGLFRMAMRNLCEDLHRRIPPEVPPGARPEDPAGPGG